MFNWSAIQIDTDENRLTWKEISEKYNVSTSTIAKAVRDGKFISNKNARKKYSYDEIADAVKKSECYSDVFGLINITINGGSYKWLKKLIVDYGIDDSHFGVPMFRGNRYTGKINYNNLEEIISNKRIKSKTLKLFLTSRGVDYTCSRCSLSEWLGSPLRLDVDHIDGNCLNNKIENLQFLCPNCHRQKTIIMVGK